ncbi:taste receptor type 1 member 2-like [Pristis pectinata]|uniref:taste receptor type 1 member 2-like n=1 Tax=Pristis pectinata TaxID=685728 RepID=UPI00223E0E41|nr:taste receptor type 1 member 2-like [Pristis pectinata]
MQLKLPGDYLIGGLLHIHDELYHGNSELEVTKCKRFSDNGYILFQTLRFAVEEINNSSSLLPNVTLGYLIFDDCEIAIDIQGALAFVSKHHENISEAAQRENRYQPTVVIGPLHSDAAIITNKILSLFEVPQISYGASSDELSDRTQYPTFMRTTPNDENQIEAILLLIQKFRWNWITVITGDNDYGENGKHNIISRATAEGICVASHHTIPTQVSDSKQEIIAIIGNIMEKGANVIVVFAHAQDTEQFFRVAVAFNFTEKVWILSEATSVVRRLSEIPNIRSIGTILGIALKQGRMPGYEEFVLRDITACNPDNHKGLKCLTLQEERPGSTANNCGATCDECVPCASDGVRALLRHSEWRVEFNVYSAVHAAAYGLHRLLQCDSRVCKKTTVYPWQVRKAANAAFRLYYILLKGCECLPCSPDQWSPARSTVCKSRSVVYLRWDEGISIALAMLSGIGLLLKASIAIIFTTYFNTPVVKAAGGKLCFILLLALAVSCSSVYSFIGEPNSSICITRNIIFMVSYKICLACVLVRSFQLVVIFKMATRMPGAYSYWVKYNGQYIFLLVSTVIELSGYIFWIFFKFSLLERNYDISKTQVILICSFGNLFFSILPIAGLIFYSLLCFVFAFLGKDLPKNYNEAKCITFSMALVLISWIFLMLVLLCSTNSYISAIEAAVILLNSYSITVGYFFPKCYIILFKPQYNTTAFFQTCIQEYTRTRDVQQP